jgi:hypothetical protein
VHQTAPVPVRVASRLAAIRAVRRPAGTAAGVVIAAVAIAMAVGGIGMAAHAEVDALHARPVPQLATGFASEPAHTAVAPRLAGSTILQLGRGLIGALPVAAALVLAFGRTGASRRMRHREVAPALLLVRRRGPPSLQIER